MLVVEKRERQLAQMLEKGGVEYASRTLAVGDILYEEGGHSLVGWPRESGQTI